MNNRISIKCHWILLLLFGQLYSFKLFAQADRLLFLIPKDSLIDTLSKLNGNMDPKEETGILVYYRAYPKSDTTFTGSDTIYIFDDFIREFGSGTFESVTQIMLVVRDYVHGKKMRACSYYNSGQKFREIHFNGERRDGDSNEYFESGKKKLTACYDNGELAEPEIELSEAGEIRSIMEKTDSAFHTINFTKEGQKYEEIFKFSNRKVVYNYYPQSGHLESEAIFLNGIQKYKAYYDSGKLKTEGLIDNDGPVGAWVDYFENGKVKSRYSYLSDGRDWERGLKDGMWIDYNEKGEAISVEVYSKGKLVDKRKSP